MPELAEVETIARQLAQLVGRRVGRVRVVGRSDFVRTPRRLGWLVGRRLAGVERRGKWLLVTAGDGQRQPVQLLLHLGMTGRLLVVPASTPLGPHTHVCIELEGEQELRYADTRRFGALAVQKAGERLAPLARLGPDALQISVEEFCLRLSPRRAAIKALLLDQRVLAGLGNIYADESLWRARLHPACPAARLAPEQLRRLWRAIRGVLAQAIRWRGTSVSDYVDLSGRPGSFQRHLRVYGRAGRPCPRCRAPIERLRIAGRSSYFCPCCQAAE